MKETVKNNASKVYHFSFYDRGRLVTVTCPPGEVAVKEAHLVELRKIETFKVLEEGGTVEVGGSKKAVAAKENSVASSAAETVEEKPKAKGKKTKAKKAEPKKVESANMDLEEL